MANHNVLITNPQGERRLQFADNLSRDDCAKWLEEYGPAPIGWMYQITNLSRKKRPQPSHTLVTGFTQDKEFVNHIKAGHKTNFGWYSIKMAKRDLRKQGAHYFTREKIWENVDAGSNAIS